MARSFSNVKTVSTLIANQITTAVTRRGYSATSQGMVARSGAPNVMVKRGSEKTVETAWVPDPVTGYYRPESQVKELDPAEMRKMLIRSRSKK